MKKLKYLFFLIFLIFFSCSNKPDDDIINNEFKKINDNIKKYLGEKAAAKNFKILNQGYLDDNKNIYYVKYQFELEGQKESENNKILAELFFFYSDGMWICYNNSADVIGMLVLQKGI